MIAFGTFVFCEFYVRGYPTVTFADLLEDGKVEYYLDYCEIESVSDFASCGLFFV